ncbi:MAG: RAMP superfamily CRISPR-associated protein [Thermoguttaceae bacterium]|nr:RAMP superfamily CRISPR-associated protein [Thermoguttaceae bacterium]MDW8078424.1 RAMP superfamily CRISPR-associated protein [Thermoguttaceae bacterium]
MNQSPQELAVQFSIHWKSPWHVGSGLSTSGVDRLLRVRTAEVVDGNSGLSRLLLVPYVPGSQLKGVLRHTCEQIVATCNGEVVSPHTVGREPPEGLLHSFRPAHESNLIVDRLFGSRYQGDCLFVEDAVPAEVHGDYGVIYGRTAVDRLTGTVREGTLFFTEVASQHFPPLKSRILARHEPGTLTMEDGTTKFPFEYALLIAGLLSIDSLGGDKSAGFGRCKINVDQIRWNGNPISVQEALEPLQDEEWYGLAELIREEMKKRIPRE